MITVTIPVITRITINADMADGIFNLVQGVLASFWELFFDLFIMGILGMVVDITAGLFDSNPLGMSFALMSVVGILMVGGWIAIERWTN